MTVSAGTETFENLKLENCRSDINKICPVCVPPSHFSFTDLLKTEGVDRRAAEDTSKKPSKNVRDLSKS